MTCKQIRDLLSPYIDNMTDDQETRAVEAHLEVCVRCREELKQLESLCAMIHDLPAPQIRDSFSEDLHRRLLEEQRKSLKPGQVKIPRKPRWVAAVAAGLVMMLGIYASNILPAGTLAFWFKADENENKPSLAVQDIIDRMPYLNNNSGGKVDHPVDINPNNSEDISSPTDDVSEGKPVENPVKPDPGKTNPDVNPVIPEEVIPRIAQVCSTRIKVEDLGDSLNQVIQMADASAAEFVSTSSSTAQIMSGTNTREVVFEVDKKKVDDFLAELGNIGQITEPAYDEVVLTEQYSKIDSKINVLEQDIQAIESGKNISADDQVKLAELKKQLQDSTSKKNQLEKQLNTVKITVYLIPQVNP